jgi:hypothetical protein
MNATATARPPARGKPAGESPSEESARVAGTESRRIREARVRQRRRVARQAPDQAARSIATILLVKPPWSQTMPVWRLLAMIPGWGQDRAQTHASSLAQAPLATLDAVARAQLASSTARACAHRTAHRAPHRSSTSIESMQRSLRTANRIRLARAAALTDVTSADSPADAAARLLLNIGGDRDLDGLAARRVIEAVPGFGPIAARALLSATTGRPDRKLSQLTPEAARQIAAALAAPVRRRYTTPALKGGAT